jgi:dTMP kinase
MMAKAQPGWFITLEGGEGAGKSTQIGRLANRLEDAGIGVITTREPGGAPGADTIRSILVSGDIDRWDPMSEALLNFAARREHLIRTIWPALERGHWVLSDRFADSTMAYQGYGHGVDRELINTLYRAAVGDFRPDMTIVLDLPVTEGLRRANQRNDGSESAEDRYERMGKSFHQRLRDGYLAIAAAEPDRCVVIDASGEPDAVARRIWTAVTAKFADELSEAAGTGD